jgi:biotin carboxyl carrier protein
VVVARTQSDLGFRVQGKILERFVDTGQTVKRGQPLMRLDPADLKLQAVAQQQAVDAARARARKAISDEARYRGLVGAGAVSASEYDQIKAAADSAKADLSAAQAQANVAQNATGYAVLLADSDGVVMETLAEPGQVVSAGQAVIRLARAGQREALVQLPETLRPPSAAKRRRRAMATKRSLSPPNCGCFPIRPMPRPAPLRRGTCWKARWRTRRWGDRDAAHQKKSGERQVMQVPLAALRCGQRTRRLAHFRAASQGRWQPSRC